MVDIAAIPQSEERDRTLNDQEIALVVHAAMFDGYPFGVLTRMLLLTAQRRNEVAGMQWAELDLVNNISTIPKERTKMKAGAHIVHISPQFRALLDLIKPKAHMSSHQG